MLTPEEFTAIRSGAMGPTEAVLRLLGHVDAQAALLSVAAARLAGQEAGEALAPSSANPHPFGSPEATAWSLGRAEMADHVLGAKVQAEEIARLHDEVTCAKVDSDDGAALLRMSLACGSVVADEEWRMRVAAWLAR